MQIIIFCTALVLGCVRAIPQDFKAKGGHNDVFSYNPNENLVSFYGDSNTFHKNGTVRFNLTKPLDYETGVCYIEVPTASLVRDPTQIPAGNGSRPDLSRIRTCCKGYIRNIHNFRICDPVCTRECVNGACTAPEVCTCFPDHVRNLAGYCVPTCPIGCQNGECVDGECICKKGYRIEPKEKKFCLPICDGNCGGSGNCTEPNVCDCLEGRQSTPDGSCEAGCGRCDNGRCVGPDECQCLDGFKKDELGECSPYCPNCGKGGLCISPGRCSCPYPLDMDEDSGDCIPKCREPCINGMCAGLDMCNCNVGYEHDPEDPRRHRCIPRCAGGCPNGICSAPNFCICNAGFVKDKSAKGSQNCVKRVKRSIIIPDPKVNVSELLIFDIPEDY